MNKEKQLKNSKIGIHALPFWWIGKPSTERLKGIHVPKSLSSQQITSAHHSYESRHARGMGISEHQRQ